MQNNKLYASNIEDVNKVITEVYRYACSGTDRIVILLEQAVAATTLQQLQQRPQPLSYAYSNNAIGTPEFAQPMNNNKLLRVTAGGIPNQFVVVLKDYLDRTSNSNAPGPASNPYFLYPGDSRTFDGNSICSSRPVVSANALRDISRDGAGSVNADIAT